MDFHSIISAAKQNVSGSDKRNDKYYKTKFEAPKKTTKERKLSHGIQKFLEKQKLEEEQKIRMAREKKLELLARRDPKEQRKIEKHLKVVKSSKKFFTGDKTLDENTEVTLQNEVPDTDDYDYESKTSDLYYQKLMEKYNKMPQEDKFAKNTTKNPKNNTVNMDENGSEIHIKNGHRQRVSKIGKSEESVESTSKKKSQPSTSASNGTSSVEKKVVPVEKPKPKIRPAPIVNFEQLLKLAEQKQHEDIVINVPSKKEPERLMTSKEKKEMEEIENARKFKHKGENGMAKIPKLGAIPRLNDSSKQDRNNNSNDKDKLSQKMQSVSDTKNLERNKSLPSTSKTLQNSGSKLRDALVKPERSSNTSPTSSKIINNTQKSQVPQSSKQPINGSSLKTSKESSSKNITNSSKMSPPSKSNSSMGMAKLDKSRLPAKEPAKVTKEPLKTREFPPKDIMRTREFPPKDLMRTREFPPKDLKRPRDFPPRDMKRPMSHQQMSRKRRVIEDEDSEYDSELDDFIDDGDDEDNSYSTEIQKIFGYDKSRYRDEDFDDREMESDYRTVMKEEFISKKIGLMEDLEDMRMEAEEKRRKELMKKKRRKL